MPTRRRLPRPIRVGLKLLRAGVIVYIVICALLFFAQRWMVFPGASMQGKPDGRIDFGSRGTIVKLTTADGTPVTAVFGTAIKPNTGPAASARPTILYFYGNGSSAAYSDAEFDHFRRLGFNVLIPDYVGYGDSGGKPGETGCYQTADAAYDWLVTQKHVDPKKIVIVGWSLGGAVAVDLASRKPAAGLATFNAFTTMPDVASRLVRWAPVRLLLRYRFDNLTKIASVKCPVMICNGSMDTLVDPAMGDTLAAAAGGQVERFTVVGADHNTIFTVDQTATFSRLGAFVERVTNPK